MEYYGHTGKFFIGDPIKLFGTEKWNEFAKTIQPDDIYEGCYTYDDYDESSYIYYLYVPGCNGTYIGSDNVTYVIESNYIALINIESLIRTSDIDLSKSIFGARILDINNEFDVFLCKTGIIKFNNIIINMNTNFTLNNNCQYSNDCKCKNKLSCVNLKSCDHKHDPGNCNDCDGCDNCNSCSGCGSSSGYGSEPYRNPYSSINNNPCSMSSPLHNLLF